MRIKKVTQTTPIQAHLTNSYSTSTEDGYSADYINGLHEYSTTEQRVGTWIDGKPLYRKTFVINQISHKQTKISISDLHIEEGFFDLNHSYFSCSVPSRKAPLIISNVSYGNPGINASASDQSGVFFESTYSNIVLEMAYNWSFSGAVVTIEYTKTTD